MQPRTTSHSEPIKHLLVEIEQGKIKLPRFQRDFVWTVKESAALIDSILKGFPIGALILWQTSEELKNVRNLGRIVFPETPNGKSVDYVLDGQQRLTSIFAALNGSEVTLAQGAKRDFSQIWVDLTELDQNEAICVADITDRDQERCIQLYRLFNDDLLTLSKTVPEDTHARLSLFEKALNTYAIPYMRLQNAPISVATEVFSRVNIGGRPLTVFEIMVARTFDSDVGFDLSEKWTELSESLGAIGYSTVDPVNLLQLTGIIGIGEARRTKILDMPKSSFIETWPSADKAMRQAVDFVRSVAGLKVSRLIPYTSSLVSIAYFFHLNKLRPASNKQSKALIKFLFLTGLVSRYTGPIETNINQDAKMIERFHETGVMSFPSDFEVKLSVDWLIKQEFRANESFSKTIMAVIARRRPLSFDNNAEVNLDNTAMRQANSKNFHHFFPKGALKKIGLRDPELSANSVVNITLVDDFLNKHKIRARLPSDYLAEFRAENENFAQALQSHLVPTGEGSPVWRDEYHAFLEARAKRILSEISRILD